MHIRIKKWIENQELKSSSFADKIGVNRATISHVLSGRNKPSIDFLYKMIRTFPDLNANWIVSCNSYFTYQVILHSNYRFSI